MPYQLTLLTTSSGEKKQKPIIRGLAYLIPGASLRVRFFFSETVPTEAESWTWNLAFDLAELGGDPDLTVANESANVRDAPNNDQIDVHWTLTGTETEQLSGEGPSDFKADCYVNDGVDDHHVERFVADVRSRVGATS